MNIETQIWYDFIHTKYGDEYLILYLHRQKKIRKWFKILTIIFSTSGIFSAFNSFKIPTIISCSLIGLVQLATSIESHLIHSEKDLDDLAKLRLMYFERCNKLEKIFGLLSQEKIDNNKASVEFYRLRENAQKIEELDNKLSTKHFKRLKIKANNNTLNYLNMYYHE